MAGDLNCADSAAFDALAQLKQPPSLAEAEQEPRDLDVPLTASEADRLLKFESTCEYLNELKSTLFKSLVSLQDQESGAANSNHNALKDFI